MPMYLRHTQAVRLAELPDHIRNKLAEHTASRQIELSNPRVWVTRSENPPASSAFGKLLRRRANPVDPDEEHYTVVVLHPTQILIVTDGVKRGTAVLSLPLAQASVATGTGLSATLNSATTGLGADPGGFTVTGFPGEQVGSFYVGLGPEVDAVECFSAVESAIAAAKNPGA
jgi:hypothetical protein